MQYIKRVQENPLIVPSDVTPSRPELKVVGVFNCGAVKYKNEHLLLCRVAETLKNPPEGSVGFPVVKTVNGKSEFEIVTLKKSDYPDYDFSDSRVITKLINDSPVTLHLTSLSHLRLARSADGINFTIDEDPTIMPEGEDECWGIEDPRITQIDDTYYINYTAVSPRGAATSLISTKDFKEYKREGMIFLPENKDVSLFPSKINGSYYAFSRPVPKAFGTPDIWLSRSDNLLDWGRHQHFLGVSSQGWDNGRIGGGAPPVLTKKGWLVIYHAADSENRYCLGALLLDKQDPTKILGKSTVPLMEPVAEYEKNGFFSDVVFSCGVILEEETLIIYYGAADDKICRGDISLKDIYKHLAV